MANTHTISNRFWLDQFVYELDPIEKLVFIHLFTNKWVNIAGVYKITSARIALETGIQQKVVERIIERLQKSEKIVYEDGYAILGAKIKHERLNTDVRLAIQKLYNELPVPVKAKTVATWQKKQVIRYLNADGFDFDFGEFSSVAPKVFVDQTEDEMLSLLKQLNKLTGGKTDIIALNDYRKKRLKALLRPGEFTKDQLLLAARNLGNNAWMQGENDNKTRYGTVDYLIRDAEKVNRFLEETITEKTGAF
jgi:hypothetical protein